MTEHLHSPHDKTREEHYPDGITNIVWDKMGEQYDFSATQQYPGTSMWSRPSIHGPSEVIGVTVRYDYQEIPITSRFVFMDGGQSMVRFDTDEHLGATVTDYKEGEKVIEIANMLASSPVTIGSRPSRLSGGKLVEVRAMSPRMHDNDSTVDVETEKPNWLSVALQVQRERLGIG